MPLGSNLINKTNKSNSILWGLYINIQKPTKNWTSINPMCIGDPWSDSYIQHQIKEKSPMILIYQYTVNNFRNCLESNKCIDDDRWNNKNRHPRQDLPQTYRVIKYVYLVCIRPTGNLLTHPTTSFRINERWSNKYDTHKSKINKIRLKWRTWRIF